MTIQIKRNLPKVTQQNATNTRPNVGRMEGFVPAKMNDASHQTPKYVVGRILQKYPNTPEGLRQALPEIQKQFPEARIVGSHGDKVDFGSHQYPDGTPMGTIDLIRAAGGPKGGEGWQWLPAGESKQAAPTQQYAQAPSMSGANNAGPLGQLSPEDLFGYLLSMLQSAQQKSDPSQKLVQQFLQNGKITP